MFERLYKSNDRERRVFGNNWCGPDEYVYGEGVLVARYEKDPEDGDGYTVEVYGCALPARFYTVRALPAPNSCDEERDGFEFTTGSDMAEWAAHTAQEIARGMVGFKLRPSQT